MPNSAHPPRAGAAGSTRSRWHRTKQLRLPTGCPTSRRRRLSVDLNGDYDEKSIKNDDRANGRQTVPMYRRLHNIPAKGFPHWGEREQAATEPTGMSPRRLSALLKP